MHIDIEARAEPLDERHGACVKLAGLSAFLRGALVVACELLGVDACERAKNIGLDRGQQGQLEGKRQHELPNRPARQALIDEIFTTRVEYKDY
jgi:hypothetical protein